MVIGVFKRWINFPKIRIFLNGGPTWDQRLKNTQFLNVGQTWDQLSKNTHLLSVGSTFENYTIFKRWMQTEINR